MNIDHKERAEKWYNRSIEEKDEFVKFLLLYIALEVSVKLKFNSIRDVRLDHSIKEKFYSKINHEYLEKLRQELDKKPLKNMNPDGNHNWSGKLESINDFNGIIEFVIRARNNLFHGDKGLDEQRDVFIAKEGTKILQPLVEAIV